MKITDLNRALVAKYITAELNNNGKTQIEYFNQLFGYKNLNSAASSLSNLKSQPEYEIMCKYQLKIWNIKNLYTDRQEMMIRLHDFMQGCDAANVSDRRLYLYAFDKMAKLVELEKMENPEIRIPTARDTEIINTPKKYSISMNLLTGDKKDLDLDEEAILEQESEDNPFNLVHSTDEEAAAEEEIDKKLENVLKNNTVKKTKIKK